MTIGSYQLNKDSGTREGQVELGVVSSDDLGDTVFYESHHLLDTGSGVWDMKWTQRSPLMVCV